MDADEVRRQLTTPLGAPDYPPGGPYRFTDREYLNIAYRTDLEALRRIVPEPLVVVEPLVRFEVMRMPDVTGLPQEARSHQRFTWIPRPLSGRWTTARCASRRPQWATSTTSSRRTTPGQRSAPRRTD